MDSNMDYQKHVEYLFNLYGIKFSYTFNVDMGKIRVSTKEAKLPKPPITPERWHTCIHELGHFLLDTKAKNLKVYENEFLVDYFVTLVADALIKNNADLQRIHFEARAHTLGRIYQMKIRGGKLENIKKEIIEWLSCKKDGFSIDFSQFFNLTRKWYSFLNVYPIYRILTADEDRSQLVWLIYEYDHVNKKVFTYKTTPDHWNYLVRKYLR